MKDLSAWMQPFRLPLTVVGLMGMLHLLGVMGLIGPSESWANHPREWGHWWGVVGFHLRHASWGHWLANAVPLVVLAGLARLLVPRATLKAWIFIPIVSGVLLWVGGRSGSHVGASALAYGWFHFLLGMGLWRRDRATIAGMMAALLLFGGMTWAFIAPHGVSWEGHLAGAIAGHWAAWKWRRLDPKPKPIVFEDDPEESPSLYATRRP